MDIEAKKKHCGLLMFDVSNVGSLEICNQHIPQNCVPRSPNYPMTILSAGAATGNDQGSVQNAPDSLGGNNEDGKIQQQPKRTPRPPNAFILYRKAKQPGIIASHKHLTNAEISKKISDMWKSEPQETILKWERLADQKKLEHMQTYPNYVYCPGRNRPKVDKRKQRRRSSNKDSPISIGPTGPVRRKSTKSSAGKASEKTTDSPSSEFNAFNAQPPSSISMPSQQTNVHSHNDSVPSSSYTILSSPEISLFPENHEELANSQKQLIPTTPIIPNAPLTPISPHQIQLRENEFNKIRQYGQLLRYDPEDLQQHAYQTPQNHQHPNGNNHNFHFTSINGLAPFYNATNGFSQPIDPLCCLIPEVIQTQQQMMSEAMLHHDQHPVTPSNGSPVSNARISLYHYLQQNGGNNVNGGASLAEILAGFECQNYTDGSVNHHPQYFH